MLTYYYIYDIVEPMLMEAITLKAYRKGFLKGIMKRSLGIENTENSISSCLVDDYRYLNKGIPNFFDYNIKDKNEAKEIQDEKERIADKIEKGKQDSDELKHSEIDTKDTTMSDAPLETLDKDKQAMSEAIKKDIEKDKENLARVEVDESEKGYEKKDTKQMLC
ncbi:hypothetical protein HpHA70_05210 [Helicobacter pylori]